MDTLDVTKMDLGQMEIVKKQGDLCGTVHMVIGELRPLAEKKGQNIVLNCPESSAMTEFDSVRMFQVMENYLSNAIRYTPEKGTIELSFEEREKEYVVQVRDTGRGVDPAELENIFLPFYRIGEKLKGSTGLGLSIVKGIMEAHGGRAWCESEGEGKGSSFFFSLPK